MFSSKMKLEDLPYSGSKRQRWLLAGRRNYTMRAVLIQKYKIDSIIINFRHFLTEHEQKELREIEGRLESMLKNKEQSWKELKKTIVV